MKAINEISLRKPLLIESSKHWQEPGTLNCNIVLLIKYTRFYECRNFSYFPKISPVNGLIRAEAAAAARTERRLFFLQMKLLRE